MNHWVWITQYVLHNLYYKCIKNNFTYLLDCDQKEDQVFKNLKIEKTTSIEVQKEWFKLDSRIWLNWLICLKKFKKLNKIKRRTS